MIFNLNIFPLSLKKKKRFHFILVYIDKMIQVMTPVSIRPYYTGLNQHILHTRFIANQGDNRLSTDNLIYQL